MKTVYINYTKEQLFSVKPTKRSASFVLKYLRFTREGAAGVSFTKDDLKRWLMPLAMKNKITLTSDILALYDKARKL